MLYVVLGEFGEYSSRHVFVSAVFTSKEAAEAAVISASARRRENDQWEIERQRVAKNLPRVKNRISETYSFESLDLKGAEKEIRPCPFPYESAERYEIAEVAVDEWNSGGAYSYECVEK